MGGPESGHERTQNKMRYQRDTIGNQHEFPDPRQGSAGAGNEPACARGRAGNIFARPPAAGLTCDKSPMTSRPLISGMFRMVPGGSGEFQG